MPNLYCVVFLSIWALTSCIQFPFIMEYFVIKNPFNENRTALTQSFNLTYYKQVAGFNQPLVVMGINQIAVVQDFSGFIQPSLNRILTGWEATATFSGDWNNSITSLSVGVVFFEDNPDAFQSILVNLTSATQTFPINSRWNSTNCQFVMYLLGWQSLPSSKRTNCSIPSPGTVTCQFDYSPGTAQYLSYNILLISNSWYSLNCLNCSVGTITPTSADFPKPTLMHYNFACMFSSVASVPTSVMCYDMGDRLTILTYSIAYDCKLSVAMFPASDPVDEPAKPKPKPQQPIISDGGIAGIVIGVVIVVAVGTILVVRCVNRRKGVEMEQESQQVIEEGQSDMTEAGYCVNCASRQAARIKPCGHQVLCSNCIDNVMMMANECPQCHTRIQGKLQPPHT